MANEKIKLNRKVDYLHNFKPLVDVYLRKKGQGAPLEASKFIFVGQDANYSLVDSSNEAFFLDYVLPYLEDYSQFLKKYSFEFHHPFLHPSCTNKDGNLYHETFKLLLGFVGTLDLQKKIINSCNFTELIPYPTHVPKGYQIDYVNAFRDDEVIQHINQLFQDILSSKNPKVVFVTPTMINNLSTNITLNKLNGDFRDIVKKIQSLGKDKYLNKIEVGIHSFYVAYHFSTSHVKKDNYTPLKNQAEIISKHLV